jgi:lysophospholipase L1-like esterase
LQRVQAETRPQAGKRAPVTRELGLPRPRRCAGNPATSRRKQNTAPTPRGQARPGAPLVGLFLTAILSTVLAACGSSSSSPTSTRRPATLHLVAIGDSIPFGQHFCGGCQTFVDLYAAYVQRRTGVPVAVNNLSQDTGIDSSLLRREMLSNPSMRHAVAAARIVTVSIGHNDTPWNNSTDPCHGGGYPNATWTDYKGACVRRAVNLYRRNLTTVLATIRALRKEQPTLVLVTNDYEDLIGDPAVPTSAYQITRTIVGAFAQTTCHVVRVEHAICIDTYRAFNGVHGLANPSGLLEPDHTHPNETGHQLIASLLERVNLAPTHAT